MCPHSCVIVNVIDNTTVKWNDEHEHNDEGDDLCAKRTVKFHVTSAP